MTKRSFLQVGPGGGKNTGQGGASPIFHNSDAQRADAPGAGTTTSSVRDDRSDPASSDPRYGGARNELEHDERVQAPGAIGIMRSVAIYARVSSEQQAQQETVGSQVAALEERAKMDGHMVLPSDRYIDEGYSGATLARPALEQLRDRIAEGGLDILYVHCPDRLARRYAYQVLLMEEFTRQGVTVIFLNGRAGQSPEDELLVQVQGVIAEYERTKILERSRRGRLHKARHGVVSVLGGAPYGYLYVRKTISEPASYQILLHEAKIVRSIFQWFVEDQVALLEIARRLTEQGVPTRRGKARWNNTTVWGMLKNPAYMGRAAFYKTERTPVAQGKLLVRRGNGLIPRRTRSTLRDRPKEDWIGIPVPAIVSPEVFAAAQEQLERNRRLAGRNVKGRRYLLQGLTVCARCNYTFYGKRVSGPRDSVHAYYRCSGTDGYKFEGGRVCHNPQVRADALDGYVWDSVREVLRDPKHVLDEWTRRGASDGTMATLREQRDEARRLLSTQEHTLRRLRDAYEAGVLDLNDLASRSERVRKRIERANQDLTAAEEALQQNVEITAVIGRLSDFAEKVGAGLENLDWDQRRLLIRALIVRVEIDEDGATIVYRVPTGPFDSGGGKPPRDGEGDGSRDGNCQLRWRPQHVLEEVGSADVVLGADPGGSDVVTVFAPRIMV
jgi:site-specific DNA recombinase